jgi:hypothetical protein
MRMSRRDSSDEKWQNLKKRIIKRDKKMCRLMRVLSAQDFCTLIKKAPKKLLEKIDCAHVFGVSGHPHMCYKDLNIVLLNRYSHENLDNCRHPITGENITKEERDKWWEKIVGENTFKELSNCSTDRMCRDFEGGEDSING